jgi:hypothetical protein
MTHPIAGPQPPALSTARCRRVKQEEATRDFDGQPLYWRDEDGPTAHPNERVGAADRRVATYRAWLDGERQWEDTEGGHASDVRDLILALRRPSTRGAGERECERCAATDAMIDALEQRDRDKLGLAIGSVIKPDGWTVTQWKVAMRAAADKAVEWFDKARQARANREREGRS